ncbi:hypothetical protein CEXT_255571 [Caerostris extrusa]|uniref:Uncharacterized protein n=1 Tax=Caerostris extrusa TaxID=172846 RepID=A0AAV4QFK8_CAEEX|nr:hypothetical protein CEXT_255571 [Caerostris extrusa]
MGYKGTDLARQASLFAAPPAFVRQVEKWKSRLVVPKEPLYHDKEALERIRRSRTKKNASRKIGVIGDILTTALSLMGYKGTDLARQASLFAAPPAFVRQVEKWKSRLVGGAESPFTPIRL